MFKRENTIQSLKDEIIEEYNGIKIQELSHVNKINLRLDPKNQYFISKCSKILLTTLPIKPNTYNKNGQTKIIWLGPNEWLIVNNNENELLIKLKNKIGDLEASVTDVSENRTVIRISGKKILILLSKFLTINLEKNLLNDFSCAQTLFAKVPILLVKNHNIEDMQIDIFANRSHANYIYNLIIDGTNNLDF